ncbi:hypothetical protein P7K49_010103 [Saguinus oedipus]|uniref:SH2 domain-containing protein n=1 Tax=Saguinus oedipus TaxID=9490 RepID=A0ABQ9VLV7_SAGOE|nr:hypothetical protein P7K49_010103 [Saguinus oedipus]
MEGRWLRGLQGDPTPAACSWYFSGVSRTQAQELLLSPPNEPGAFLVRPSESSLGGYSLSVRAQASVCHYRVSMAADGSLYLQKGQLFPGLKELLIYYKANWKLIQNPLLRPCMSQVGLCLPCAYPRHSLVLGAPPNPIAKPLELPEERLQGLSGPGSLRAPSTPCSLQVS